MELIEALNRTMKMAMDEGRVSSYEEAITLFDSFRLRVVVRPGFSRNPGEEAAILTLLNAAPKTFLGGVELIGPLQETCTRAWFAGMNLEDVAVMMGVRPITEISSDAPTIAIGCTASSSDEFLLHIRLTHTGFTLSPDAPMLGDEGSPVEAGVAAAGAALSEAFLYAYRRAPLAGLRCVRWDLPSRQNAAAVNDLWVIGLGHVGQAFLWTLALEGGSRLPASMRLTDYDEVSTSSLSTCLLVSASDVGRKKVDVVAERFSALGVEVHRDYDRLSLGDGSLRSQEETVVVAVDNIAFRRSLDRLLAPHILEAGIGDGARAFTRIQLHAFPGQRKARDIWCDDGYHAPNIAKLAPAYQDLLLKSGDKCGTALVAGRSVATPFVGAFAGALLSRLLKSEGIESAWSFDVASL